MPIHQRQVPVSVSLSSPAAKPQGRREALENPREITRFGDRLASELAVLVELLPPRQQSASAMSRWLNINRGTCQRVLLAARASGDGAEALRRAPGVEGLEQFVRAIALRLGRRPEVDRAEAMVLEYARLVLRAGGSQTKLVRAATQRGTPVDEQDDSAGAAAPGEQQFLAARQAIYQASCITCGTWAAANIGLQAFRPSESAPGKLDSVHARGFVGARRRPDGLAISSRLSGLQTPALHTTLEGETGPGRQWSALLAGFCTLPLPTVITQPENGTMNSIVLGDNAVERPVDVILGGRGVGSDADPRFGKTSYFTTLFGLRFPSRWQLYDLYLHRDLATGGRVFANALVLNPRDTDPVHNWFDKLPYEIPLRAMGPGQIRVTPAMYARMGELTAWVFERAGWDPSEFEAWRVELEYPTPGIVHALTLHTAKHGEDASSAE